MRVAALYDVHGMPWALEAVMAEVNREGFDAVVFGGDLFCGPLPVETLELVRAADALFVRGNCERAPDEWLRAQLGAEALAWSAAWPPTIELDGVLYCHATPQSDAPILTEASPSARFEAAQRGVEARFIVAGHTHMQFRRGRWVNAGSIGMPYEDDVAAFWAVVGDDIEFRRTAFDVERAVREIESSGWSEAESFVRENLLTPPSRQEATQHFESLA